MDVLVIRHGVAVEAGTTGVTDAERPLTAKGEAKFRRAARGLARIHRRPDVLLTSPLVRARRTAKIAARAWGRVKPTLENRLAGQGVAKMLAVLREHRKRSCVALVGHEPDVSALVARLLGAGAARRLAFEKGGAALVALDASLEHGRLVWFLPPRALRRLA